MELTIQNTVALLLSKAMAMPPPPPVLLARKRSWAEMSHLRNVPYISSPPPASLQLKKSKRTLASSSGFFALPTEENEHPSCCECDSMDALSADAQQFLADDPFDFAAPPHPVLTRQQAVYNVCDYNMFVNEDASDSDDDDMMGHALGSGPAAVMPLPPRWNLSVVGASLANAGRPSATALVQPRRM